MEPSQTSLQFRGVVAHIIDAGVTLSEAQSILLRAYVDNALFRTDGKMGQAASILGVPRNTFGRMAKK